MYLLASPRIQQSEQLRKNLHLGRARPLPTRPWVCVVQCKTLGLTISHAAPCSTGHLLRSLPPCCLFRFCLHAPRRWLRTLVIEKLPPANLDFVQAHGIRLVQIGVEGNKVRGGGRFAQGHGSLASEDLAVLPWLDSARCFLLFGEVIAERCRHLIPPLLERGRS